jgi:selenocysteine-specific elongation factor
LARLTRLLRDDLALDVWLADAGMQGLDRDAIVRRGGAGPADVDDRVRAAVTTGDAVLVEGRVFASAALHALERDILAELAAWHADHPEDPGPLRESVRERVARHAATALSAAALIRLRDAGRITAGERLALASFRPKTTSADDRAAETIETALREGGLAPPDAAAMAAAAGVTAPIAERLLHRLAHDRRVVRVEALWFHPDALESLRRDVRAIKAHGTAAAPATVDVATFKARYGVSRKYAIPLLEWLDRERVTRRVGDRRVIL